MVYSYVYYKYGGNLGDYLYFRFQSQKNRILNIKKSSKKRNRPHEVSDFSEAVPGKER